MKRKDWEAQPFYNAENTLLSADSLLVSESPLMVLPSLALAVGLNGALFLQQLHYWLRKSPHYHEGRTWVYNTYVAWREQFPFWSIDTLKRTIHDLVEQGVLLTGNFNKHPMDRTLWYSLDRDRLLAVARAALADRLIGKELAVAAKDWDRYGTTDGPMDGAEEQP